MREAFELTRGAVSKKDLVPVLTHFAVHDGYVHGYNGRIHICSPALGAKKLSFTIPAVLALAALDSCRGELTLTHEEERVTVVDSASKFKAVLPTGKIEEFPVPKQIVPPVKISTPILPTLRALAPFIGEDASRPWCASVRFQNGMAYATNNVVAVSIPFKLKGAAGLNCALPMFAVEELLRIGQEPLAIAQEDTHALWFFLPHDVWIRTQLIAEGWPDVGAVLDKVHEGAKLAPVSGKLRDAVERVKPFCPDPKLPAIVFKDGHVRTRDGASTASFPGFPGTHGTYHADPLLTVLAAATSADWSKFPRVPFVGANGLRGGIMGLAE